MTVATLALCWVGSRRLPRLLDTHDKDARIANGCNENDVVGHVGLEQSLVGGCDSPSLSSLIVREGLTASRCVMGV